MNASVIAENVVKFNYNNKEAAIKELQDSIDKLQGLTYKSEKVTLRIKAYEEAKVLIQKQD